MAQIALSNTAPDTLLVGDISASTGTIIVSTGTGSAFPAVPFRVGIDREAMLVTAVNGDTFTVTRGYDGTASAPHVSGDQVQHIHTATDFPFRVDDTSGEYIGQAGIDMATFAISNVGAFALRSIGGDITNVGSITSNVGSDLVLKPEGASYAVELSTSAGKKRIVAETDNIRFYTANGLSETLIWDEAGIEWELQAKFNVNTQPFVGIDELVSAATKDLTLRPLDSDKAVSIKNYLEDPRIVVGAADITFYQSDGTTPTLTWVDASTEWQLQSTFNANGEDITGVEVLTSTATADLSLRPGNASYAAVLAASNGNKRVAAETNDITFYKADGISQTLRWDQTGDEWEFGETINANFQTLLNVLDPTDDSHVGDRGYNDTRYQQIVAGGFLPLSGGTMAGTIEMDANGINKAGYIRLGDPAVSTARYLYWSREYVGTAIEARVTVGGPTGGGRGLVLEVDDGTGHTAVMSMGTLANQSYVAFDMNNETLHSPLDPTAGTHVGDRDYNDGRYAAIVAGGYLPLSGGTMTGDIDMSGNVLESVDAALYLDATSSGTVAQNIYLRTDDATGTRRNRIIIDGDGNVTFYDQAGGQAMLYGTSYMQIDKNLTVGDNTLYGVADPTADGHVGDRAYNDGRYALSGTGVTNGDLHDHAGGDGAAISHTDLIGLSPSQHHVRYSDAEAIAAVGTVMNGVPSGASLPLTGIAGDLFFLTVDEKLYRHNGTTWLVTTATSDLSGTITETQIEDNAITTGKLDANAVTAAKIEASTITSAEIATDTILAGNIAAGAIEASEIATGAVTADAILAGAITTVSMTANTIDGDRITANTLDAAKITAGTITTDRMTAGTIDADRLIADSVTATQIDAGTITTTELAANLVLVTGQAISASYLAGVSGWQIQQSGTAEFNEVIVRGALIGQAGSSISADYLTAGTIDAATIDVENLSADNITTGTLSADRIAANSLDASKITAGTITTDRMTVNTIDGDRITAGTLDADRITAGTITTDRMTAGTIDGDRITTNTLDADRITAGTITTDRMTAGTIDADRLIADSVTATQIDAGTITATELAASIVLVTGQAISASYVLDTSGWKIWQDGNAEFNEVTVRGALIAQAGSVISADYLTAGTIDAAVIDVTNLDADNITTGTLSADRIAAGSLDAVKITAGSITTDRMTANTIDGDRILADSLEAAKIVAGSITTDRMTANSIDGDRISAGSLDATKITAGTITTDRFSANTISGTIITAETLDAAKITAGSIGTDRMTAGTINADRLISGSITATQLAADSITAGKLAVQTMSNNMMPNPDFVWDSIGGTDDPHDYSTTYGGAFSAGTARLTGGVRSLRYTYGTGGPGTTWSLMGGNNLGRFPAKEGDKFYVSMWIRTALTAPLASPYYPFNVNWRQEDETYIGASQPSSISLSTTWTQVSVTATAPANTSYFNIFLNHEYTGSETGAETVEYSNITLERVSPTVLIDNGAITTDKLFANAVTADKIEAGTITANEIATDTISADRWVGDLTLVSGQAISGSYSAGSAGWQIAQDGTAEFSNVNIRGTSTVDGAVITENLSASAITTGTIGAETITLTNSASSKITSNDGASWYIRGDGVALFNDVTISGDLDTSTLIGDLVLAGGTFKTASGTNERIELRSGGSPEYYGTRLLFYDTGTSGTNYFANIFGDSSNYDLYIYAANSVRFGADIDMGLYDIDADSITLGGILNIPADTSESVWAHGAIYNGYSGATGNYAVWRAPYTASWSNYMSAGFYGDAFVVAESADLLSNPRLEVKINPDQVRVTPGTAQYPGLAFTNDTGTGLYRYSAGQIGFSTGNFLAARMYDDGSNGWIVSDVILAENEFQAGDGSSGDPSITFANAGTTGFYQSGGALWATVTTAAVMGWGSSQIIPMVPLRMNTNGSQSAPAFSWNVNGDTNTGIWRIAENYMGLACAGQIMQQWGFSGGGSKELYFYGLPAASTNYVRYNGTSGQLGYSSSTLRIKKDVRPLEVGLTDFMQPSWFRYRANDEIEEVSESSNEYQSSQFRVAEEDENKLNIGLIAEWTADIHEAFGIYNEEDPTPVNYQVEAVLAATIADLQDARKRLAELEALVAKLGG